MHSLDWLGFGVMMAILAVTGLRRSQKSEEYLLANRQIGLLALTATLVMTEFNTSILLSFSSFGYRVGPMAIGLPLVFLIGLTWYMFTVARPWKRFNRLSVAELFTERYGRALGRLASLLLIIAMLGFSATYVKSLTLIFAPWFRMNTWVLSFYLTTLVLLMTVAGGLRSVVRTDAVSFVVTLVLIPALFFLALDKYGMKGLHRVFPADQLVFSPVAQWNHPALPFWFITSLIVLTCFTYICSPWYGQKIFAARNERIAFTSVGLASIMTFLLYTSMVLAAAFFRIGHPALADAQMVLPEMMETWLPAFWRGIGYAVLFMAAMTTLTGVWSAMVAMMKADFFPTGLDSVHAQRLFTGLFAVISWLGANVLVDNILNRLILANIPIAALSFALLAGFHWKRASAAGAWVSVIAGVAWGTGCFIYFGDAGGYTWYWAVYGIPLIFISGIVSSFLWPDAVWKPQPALSS
ncbi:MAG: sodium:solute symporter family protein [Pseudomonadota bacterium]|nr:sodium:solute symporter family protein [Pseudomonadota bacterium]